MSTMTATKKADTRAAKPGFTDIDFTEFARQEECPGLDELVRRARALRPLLLANQAECERLTQPPLEVHQALVDAGFFKIITPKKYGGWEMGVWAFVKITMEIARGCPSTGWCYSLGYGHTFTAGSFFPASAQDELFGDAHGYLCAASFGYPRGTARRVDGGYVVSGDFPYGSGSPYSNFYMGETLAPAGSPHGPEGTPLFFAVHRDQYELMDDWGKIMGLKGSGSQTVRLKDSFIPDNLVVATNFSRLSADENGVTLGYAHHGNGFFRIPQLAFASNYANAVMVGAAYAALDEYEQVAKTKKPQNISALGVAQLKLQAQVPEVQKNYGLATADIEAAESILRGGAAELEELGQRGYKPEDIFRMTMQIAVAGKVSWKAVEDILWRTVGSSQGREGCRMERYWRDLSIAWNSPNNGYREAVATGFTLMHWGEFLDTLRD
jgi:3-hydroxy-9,10-secoandrosta-1,3,5(10)-triene-9,17-dione monooxygenase